MIISEKAWVDIEARYSKMVNALKDTQQLLKTLDCGSIWKTDTKDGHWFNLMPTYIHDVAENVRLTLEEIK